MSQIHEVFPYLMVRDSKPAIAFYQRAFGATELFRLVEPSGRIGHAELQLGPAVLMVCDEFPEYGMVGPQTRAVHRLHDPPTCGQRRRDGRACGRGRGHDADAAHGPVLW